MAERHNGLAHPDATGIGSHATGLSIIVVLRGFATRFLRTTPCDRAAALHAFFDGPAGRRTCPRPVVHARRKKKSRPSGRENAELFRSRSNRRAYPVRHDDSPYRDYFACLHCRQSDDDAFSSSKYETPAPNLANRL
ncbi:hypothetical protein [Burkholderia ubonensis]|uniref:hypothetical protein n=1 Tax=Burkholderia ubonensis TaxID=101571 RepID=UPI0012FB6FBC|nr:hypothetical protein [Burkholderia ubonensis]